jgi:predicted Zn-ribbon and HTH transcriptional regulator
MIGSMRLPDARSETVRESLRRVLREGSATAKDLSRAVGIPEREVGPHLEHLARSLRHRAEKLVIEPAACLACDFSFAERRRATRPGRCPKCRSVRISLPAFRIEEV